MKLFRLLEDTCHQFDLQLAYMFTCQEESISSSSFLKYADEWKKLLVAKAKIAEAQSVIGSFGGSSIYVNCGCVWGGQPNHKDVYPTGPGHEKICGKDGKK